MKYFHVASQIRVDRATCIEMNVIWGIEVQRCSAEWMDSADEGVLRVQQIWKAIESEYSQFRTTDILLQRLRDAASRAQLGIAHDLWEKGRTM